MNDTANNKDAPAPFLLLTARACFAFREIGWTTPGTLVAGLISAWSKTPGWLLGGRRLFTGTLSSIFANV